MKRRKNLERAIVLGLLLSTSVYGNAWADVNNRISKDGLSPKDISYGDYEISGTQFDGYPGFGIKLTTDNETGEITETTEYFDSLTINIYQNLDSVYKNPYLAGIITDGGEKKAILHINSENLVDISATSQNNFAVTGVWAQSEDTITINSVNSDVNIHATKDDNYGNNSYNGQSQSEHNRLRAVYGINASKDPAKDAINGSTINITANNGNINITSNNESTKINDDFEDANTYAAANDHGNIILEAGNKITLNAETRSGNVYGLDSWGGLKNHLTADSIEIVATNFGEGDTFGIKVKNGGQENRFNSVSSNKFIATSNKGNAYGVYVEDNASINIASNKNNYISADVNDLDADNNNKGIAIKAGNSEEPMGATVLVSGEQNYINADETGYIKNQKVMAVKAENGAYVDIKANVGMNADNSSLLNKIGGAVYAKDAGTFVNIYGKGENGEIGTNRLYSYSVIENAGNLDTSDGSKFEGKQVVSALYAENGAEINLTGENYIGTWADNEDEDTLERTVWAYDESSINITGAVQLKTDEYASSPNSADVAVAAGTATGLTYTMVDEFDGTRAEVNVKYDDFANSSASSISGDILSAYAGLVNIDRDNKNAGIKIEGNLLAGNNGILNVDIGKGGILTGRADDYGDAGVVQSNEHQEFYNPTFSSTIYKGGRVDLGMGAGSTWFVTGQSWITTIDTTEAKGDAENERAKIDLVTEYKDKDGGDIAAHALTVYDFKGDADFLMNLSGNRADTDMLYMKHAEGHYRIMLDEDITSTDINQDKEGNEYSGLRFATVGADSKVTFDVGSYDNGGAFNVEYEVGKDVYGSAETAHENEAYNGTELNGGKPGDNMVDNFFGSEGEPVTDESANEGGISTTSANGIMLMNEEVETFADEENNANKYNAINHKIIAIKDTELNDTGKTILNMSRANYSNAIYMDRLNKRLGEARYINDDPEEDEGMWVRIRHDRIGKDDAYRSQNTMYELGYDKKQDCDNGERRVGFAVDYMHGDTGYTDIAGKGEIDRYGLWLYDTWMGDKGHYVDYVAKWGHLDNDFEVYTMRDSSQKVTGDYSNNVFSVSAEYGRKKDIGNDWYFEPQAQLQLARVTGADYTTNQGTKVSVDGINSLIGRAGFRIGKDFGEEKQSTLYFKADVLHEFLGDQDVYVMDKSTDNKWAGISYENEGTWYDIGIGYAAMMSKSSYAFIDLEQSFGNDNDDTYQINAGVQWTF